jgi:type II secretory pathway component PulC
MSNYFSESGADPSRIKAPAKEAIVQELTVSRSDLKLALGDELKTAQIRAVEVFQNSSGISQTFPNFRLFDIQDGSVYSLLGLKNVDILVAINERSVVAPQVIGQIVRLLSNEKGVTFEVIRAGKSLVLKVRFV